MLVSLRHVYGDDRPVVVCRELTKKFEEVTRGTAAEVSTAFEGRNVKGELVVLVGRATKQAVTVADVETALREAMKTMRVKDAASVVAGSLGLPRRAVYQIALGMEM